MLGFPPQGSGLCVGLFHGSAATELDAATVIDAKALHAHLIADLADVLDGTHALVGELGDVAESVLARQNLDERAELLDAGDGALIGLAGLGLGRDGVNLALGGLHHLVGRG